MDGAFWLTTSQDCWHDRLTGHGYVVFPCCCHFTPNNTSLIFFTTSLVKLEIRSVERGICLIAEPTMTNTHFHCACAKLPCFYFRSEIVFYSTEWPVMCWCEIKKLLTHAHFTGICCSIVKRTPVWGSHFTAICYSVVRQRTSVSAACEIRDGDARSFCTRIIPVHPQVPPVPCTLRSFVGCGLQHICTVCLRSFGAASSATL